MNIIEMAREAGFVEYELEDYTQSGYDIRYERLVELARADEREECAKVCIQMANRCDDIRKAALEVAAENIITRGTHD